MEWLENPEMTQCIYGQLFYDKRGKAKQCVMTVSSTNNAGKTGQLHVKILS